MRLRIQDQDANPIGTNGFNPRPLTLNGIEASRVEAFEIKLDVTGEHLILTLTLEES